MFCQDAKYVVQLNRYFAIIQYHAKNRDNLRIYRFFAYFWGKQLTNK